MTPNALCIIIKSLLIKKDETMTHNIMIFAIKLSPACYDMATKEFMEDMKNIFNEHAKQYAIGAYEHVKELPGHYFIRESPNSPSKRDPLHQDPRFFVGWMAIENFDDRDRNAEYQIMKVL